MASIFERLQLPDPVGERRSRAPAVDHVEERVRRVAVEAMRFGIRRAFAIGRTHYSNIDLEAMRQGFPATYTEEELDAIEEEVAPPGVGAGRRIERRRRLPLPFHA